MELINTIISWFKKPKNETHGKTPKGLCPVCWGYQEYDRKIRKLYKDRQIEVNNHKDNYMFVEDIIKKYVDGIRLKKGEIINCSNCRTENMK
ncbi:MAG: hypothetical protein A2046_10650 [Bacteroidetes bacterium GWA2_30_7]|nr:MAG: hypothetical protein A2046_10650 [Bacteroidetes bacterium GWA2_30_7]